MRALRAYNPTILSETAIYRQILLFQNDKSESNYASLTPLFGTLYKLQINISRALRLVISFRHKESIKLARCG
jgi:hypothetical protein